MTDLGPLGGLVCLSCGASPGRHQAECAVLAKGLEPTACRHIDAFRNLATAQVMEALAEPSPEVQRGMLRVLEMLDAVIEIETARP